jgi:hypothetical protein
MMGVSWDSIEPAALTAIRLEWSLYHLIVAAESGNHTPVSGDSLVPDFRLSLAETRKMWDNLGMDNYFTFTVSENKLYSTALHHVVPIYVDVTFTDVDFTTRFFFDETSGAYIDDEGNALTVEWDGEHIVRIDVPEI